MKEAFLKVTSSLPAVTSKANNTALFELATTIPLAGFSGERVTAKVESFLTILFSGFLVSSFLDSSFLPINWFNKSSNEVSLFSFKVLAVSSNTKPLVAGVV